MTTCTLTKARLARTVELEPHAPTGETSASDAGRRVDDHGPGGYLRLPHRLRAAAGQPLPRPRQKGQRRRPPPPSHVAPPNPSRLEPWIFDEF